jgi:acetyltransferase
MKLDTKDTGQVAYPSQFETEVVLNDGSAMVLRPIKIEDAQRYLAFLERLGPDSRYLWLNHVPEQVTPEDALRFCTVDYKNSFALVGEVLKQKTREIVAVGRYYRLPRKNSAEVAIVIDDNYRRKGIGTRLIECLVNAARDNGITTFEADVSAKNGDIIALLKGYGYHISRQLESDSFHVAFPIAPTQHVMHREEERDRVATIASIRHLLCPKSVALIGASRYQGTIGNIMLRCMLQGGYSGTVYPVNPNIGSVMSVKTYASILDIPDEVDLAVIVVPAKLVARVADECGQKGVRTLIVISDGFREVGPEGAAREQELRNIALGHGMRVAGPNCMGILNTDAEISLNATFSPVFPPAGNVAFLSQSGAMGLTILEYAQNLNLGVSTFVSVGNRVDISPNDLLEYWEQDKATKVILLYLESFGNPRKFAQIARRVSAKKPIVVVKGGSTAAGSKAAASHTGSMATSDVSTDVLFKYAGILRVATMEELFDVASLLSNQPLPKGRKLAILTNGGGPGIIAADASARHNLALPQFSPETIAKLKSVIKRDIVINNPLDTTAGATAQEFHDILQVLANEKDIDAVLCIFIPPIVSNLDASEDAIRSVAPVFWKQQKPLLACFLGERGSQAKLGSNGHFVPCYPFPEEAVSALARAVEYSENLRKPAGTFPKLEGIERGKARRIIEKAMTENSQRPFWLSVPETYDLLGCYGIRLAPMAVAKTAAEAADAAAKMGFPVVVKLVSATITHKTDVGGVVIGLRSKNDVKKAFDTIHGHLVKLGRENEMQGVMVQRMVMDGIETIVGVTQDPSFGPLMMFGAGGIYAELLKDVTIRLPPLTDLDAREMIKSIKMAKMLEGYRDTPAADTEAVEDLLLRLSAMVEDIHQISELDFNPVKVMPKGAGYWVVDARIMLK